MAAKRDYKAAYARRDERARAAGFKNYYDQRVRENELANERPRGERLRRLRGHSSGADLLRAAKDGDLLVASLGGRRADGTYSRVDITLVSSDGGDQEFTLRGPQLKQKYLVDLVEKLGAIGVIFSPAPSLDLNRIAEEA